MVVAEGWPVRLIQASGSEISPGSCAGSTAAADVDRATTPHARSVATKSAGGPIAGGGGSLEHLTPGEAARVQNAANKIDQPISVVGSRASGTAGPYSDWDYVVEGANILCRDAGAALATSVSVAEATGVGREE